MKAILLQTEHMINPMGIGISQPMLSWNAENGGQRAYEILAAVNGETVWCSGKVESSSCLARCGYKASARERVEWRIRLWDERDCPGGWAEAWYEIGLLHPSDWSAKWIDPEVSHDEKKRQPASVLRRRFAVEKKENARLYITCHGLYEVWINDLRVGAFVLAPGTDDYKKRLEVQSYDISGLLRRGENEITVTLGDGWYRGSVGVDGICNYYGSDVALLCQLEIDGRCVLASDEKWEARQNGPTWENDLQKGECYDARLENITEWHSVSVRDYGYDTLCCSNSVPIKEQERFPGKLITTPNGETVIDFGQNIAGYTEICLTAKAGQKLTLWHGEALDGHGNFTQENYNVPERNKNGGIPQKLEYICKTGENVWKPRFTIFGFRYAKLETTADLTDAEFTAIAVYSEMARTGFFECGNTDVNRLFLNSLWSMRSNFCDVPTDCPTRERAGWTGDAGVFAPTGVYLTNCYPIFRKWLAECRLAQHDDGCVENISPVNDPRDSMSMMLQGSAGWGDACVLVPWALYEAYGDTSILEENYEMMCRWLDFVGTRAQNTREKNLDNPYKDYLVDQGVHFGEWCEPDVDTIKNMIKISQEGASEVATAYYYRSAFLVSQIAGILEKPGDAQKYADIAEGAKQAYRFSCTKEGRIESMRQAEYVRPIAFGLLNGEENQAAADILNELVRKNGYHLNTGFLSTPFLCKVLSECDHTDTAYRLLLQEECPGWLYEVKKGATTIWETWGGVRSDGTVHDSLNHYSYGAVSGWLFNGVCGIRLSAGKLSICPKPSPALGWAKAEWISTIGMIRSAWNYEGKTLHLNITVPIPAHIELPDREIFDVDAGEYHYSI